MRILDRSVYVGPSLHARFPVIRLELDLGELEEWPTGRLGSGFVDALALTLPGLAEHGCSYGEPGGLMRTNIPSFRLPATVIDEEIAMITAMTTHAIAASFATA